MSELTFIFGKIEDFESQGIDATTLRKTVCGRYCIKHINLISSEVYNNTKFDDGFIGLSAEQANEVMCYGMYENEINIEEAATLVDAFVATHTPVNPYEDLLLSEMGV